MGELAGIGADVEDDAAGFEPHMAADAVFHFEPVEPGLPAMAVELPAPRRGDGDLAPVDAHEEILPALIKRDRNIAADSERCVEALAEKLHSDLKR